VVLAAADVRVEEDPVGPVKMNQYTSYKYTQKQKRGRERERERERGRDYEGYDTMPD
jgi:hypothetical protein